MRIGHHLAWVCVIACHASPTATAVAVSSPPVHVDCGDIARIGQPVAPVPSSANAPELKDMSVSREGCVIAARTKDTLWVSWDGGASFARIEQAAVTQFVALSDRVVVLLEDGRVGTVMSDRRVELHPAPIKTDHPWLLGGERRLVYSGATSQGTDSDDRLAIPEAGTVAVSDNGGASWRYLATMKGMSVVRVDGDRLVASVSELVSDDDSHTMRVGGLIYASDARDPAWRQIGSHFTSGQEQIPLDTDWRYALEQPAVRNCPNCTDSIIEVASHQVVIDPSGHRMTRRWGGDGDEAERPYVMDSNRGVTFGLSETHLMRLVGTRATDIAALPPGTRQDDLKTIGVDRAGTAIVRTTTQLLRWSQSGGWRVLLDATR
jgi:hypothetical protein